MAIAVIAEFVEGMLQAPTKMMLTVEAFTLLGNVDTTALKEIWPSNCNQTVTLCRSQEHCLLPGAG